MNADYVIRLLAIIKMKCPLCNEKYKYRVNLRHHLKREHTDIDAEKIFEEKSIKIRKK